MKLHGMLLATLAGVLLAVAPLYAQNDNISTALKAASTALGKQDYQTAWKQCRTILEEASKRQSDTLTGQDWYAIGVAHYYLAAQAMNTALESGKLSEAETKFALGVQKEIMPQGPQVRVIGHGQTVNLESYLQRGKTTVFDFYSQYCPSCRAISPRLDKLATQRHDLAIVKVDINRPNVQGIDWQSPVARQFNLNSIPHFMIYGPDGKLASEGDQAREQIEEWIAGQQ